MLTLVAILALQAAPPSCEDSALHRQFDFWAGDWNVYDAGGSLAGSNTIEAGAGGCVLHEHWTDANGGTGHSLNWADNDTGAWRQLWVGPRYQIDYSGGLNASGAMILEGVITYGRPEGPASFDFRGAWIPQENGQVIQYFQQFDPASDTWTNWGLLTYVPRATPAHAETRSAPASGPVIETVPAPFDSAPDITPETAPGATQG